MTLLYNSCIKLEFLRKYIEKAHFCSYSLKILLSLINAKFSQSSMLFFGVEYITNKSLYKSYIKCIHIHYINKITWAMFIYKYIFPGSIIFKNFSSSKAINYAKNRMLSKQEFLKCTNLIKRYTDINVICQIVTFFSLFYLAVNWQPVL